LTSQLATTKPTLAWVAVFVASEMAYHVMMMGAIAFTSASIEEE
jgi:hypothetical protein